MIQVLEHIKLSDFILSLDPSKPTVDSEVMARLAKVLWNPIQALA